MTYDLSKHRGRFIYTVRHTHFGLLALYHSCCFANKTEFDLSQLKFPFLICIPTFVRHEFLQGHRNTMKHSLHKFLINNNSSHFHQFFHVTITCILSYALYCTKYIEKPYNIIYS
jgi:hypothetical protein